MSPTGLKPAYGSFYRNVEIICLDKWQRLQFNFAVNANGKYTEFANLAAARKFIRAVV